MISSRIVASAGQSRSSQHMKVHIPLEVHKGDRENGFKKTHGRLAQRKAEVFAISGSLDYRIYGRLIQLDVESLRRQSQVGAQARQQEAVIRDFE